MSAAIHRDLLGNGSERQRRKVSETPMINTTPTSNPTNCGLWVGTDPADGAIRFFCASEPATAKSGIT